MSAQSLLFLPLLLLSCAEYDPDREEDFLYNNAIFQGVELLQAAQSGRPERPNFSWPAAEEDHVVCALFSEAIDVQGREISNPEAVIWLWHSGLGAGRDGNILFEHGLLNNVEEGDAVLPSGAYFWAVWALSPQGLPIMATQEMLLEVP